MNMGIGLYARLELSMPGPGSISPLIGLSPLELEAVLKESLKDVSEFHEKNPEWKAQNPPEKRGNYLWGTPFKKNCEKAKGLFTTSEHLATPQVFAEKKGNKYETRYNAELTERITQLLSKFKRDEQVPVAQIFSRQFAKQREWIVEQQALATTYLCQRQDTYLVYGSPFDLQPLIQRDIADEFGYSISTISRLLRNLTIQVPDGRVIFAEELVPGAKLMQIKGIHALRLLQENPDIYRHGKWQKSDDDLMPLLEDEFGMQIARRTITKYRHIISDNDQNVQ